MKSLQGHLLAASPRMADRNFARTVILLLHHSQSGALGVVLNRPFVAPAPLASPAQPCGDALQVESTPLAELKSLRLNLGGPVPSPVIAIHKAKSIGEVETQPGLFVATQQKHLNRLLKQHRYPFRLFVGHASWSAGQLESELGRGDWLVTPAMDGYIFAEDDELWRHVLRHIGWSVLQPALNIKHIPADVSWN